MVQSATQAGMTPGSNARTVVHTHQAMGIVTTKTALVRSIHPPPTPPSEGGEKKLPLPLGEKAGGGGRWVMIETPFHLFLSKLDAYGLWSVRSGG